MRQQRQLHPITQASFSEWKQNIITKQLHEDLESFILGQLDYINPKLDETSASLAYAALYSSRQLSDIIINWEPENLEKDED